MKTRALLGPLSAGILAFGSVGAGRLLEGEALAANQSWDFGEECWMGCSHEESDEYYRNGAYKHEVRYEPGTNNREEMLELSGHSESWCHELLVNMRYVRGYSVIKSTDCTARNPTLGWY